MRQNLKSAVTATIAVLGMAFFAQFAAADTLSDIKARGTAMVAIDLGTPPFGSVDNAMKPQGLDVDVAEKIAKDLGVKLQIVQVTGPNRIPFLLTSKADFVVSSFGIRPERQKVIDFSKPYIANPLLVAARDGKVYKNFTELLGKRVAVVRGSGQDIEITAKAPQGVEIVRYDDDATVINAFLTGQADVFGGPLSTVLVLAKNYPDRNIVPGFDYKLEPLGIGMRKGDDALRNWLDEWVMKNRADGTLGGIFKKWTGVALPDMTGL